MIISLTFYLLCSSLPGLLCLSPYLGDIMEAVSGGGEWFARLSYWQHISDFSLMYWGWMLCLFFFFLVQCKEIKICDFFLQSFSVRREVLLILIGSGSSLNYPFWLLSYKKYILQGENIWTCLKYPIISKITFCFTDFLVTCPCVYFEHFLCLFISPRRQKKKRASRASVVF